MSATVPQNTVDDEMPFLALLVRIKQQAEFEPLRKWLAAEDRELSGHAVYRNSDIEVRHAQGAAREVKRFIGLIEGSRGVLEKRSLTKR